MSAYAVIIAGGTGTRLWPYSRRSSPKQLLPLLGETSLLQGTVERLAPFVPPERIVVVTNREYVAEVRDQLPQVPASQIIGEPSALGTAAAVGLGAAVVGALDESATMFVLPADHVIEPTSGFQSDLARAAEVAASGRLVTFGIPPTGPETGYGYVEIGDLLPGEAKAHDVVRFVEKPDQATAEGYVAGGRHLWNSGMFAWTVDGISRELEAHLPELAERVRELTELARSDPGGMTGIEVPAEGRADEHAGEKAGGRLSDIWDRIVDRTTIDYGVMEQSQNVGCVPASFTWNDVGSWSALADSLDTDDDDNALVGPHIAIDTSDSLVFGRSGRLVAVVGLSEFVVVDTPDALLVCPRDRTQDVRRIVDQLKATGGDALL